MIDLFSMSIGIFMFSIISLVILYAQHTTDIWPFRSVRVERAEEKAAQKIALVNVKAQGDLENAALTATLKYKEIYIKKLESDILKLEDHVRQIEAVMLHAIKGK